MVGYMHKPLHHITSAKGSKDRTKWWEDASIASGAFDGRVFVVDCQTIGLTKMSREEETPPTYGDICRTKYGIHRRS